MKQKKMTSIGGQALIEGVMMKGPSKTAMAVRNTSGEIVVEQWENKTNKPKFWTLPFFRGMYSMIESYASGYKTLMRSAELAGFEEDEKENTKKSDKALMVVAVVLAVVLAIGLFMLLPSFLYKLIFTWIDGVCHTALATNSIVRGIFEGVFRMGLFLVYIVLVSLMKDIRRTFMYHGAEHKTIFCYENGEELTIENVRRQSRFHPRCGTSFLILTLLVGMLVSICIQIDNVWLRTLIKIALFPVTVGIGYELIKWTGRKNNWLTRAVAAPGLWIQRITTKEPDDSMIECAIAAFLPVIPEEENADNW